MDLVVGIVLLLNAVFNFLAWPPFLRRVAKDPRSRDAQGRGTRYLRVHQLLVALAVLLALASAALGLLSLGR